MDQRKLYAERPGWGPDFDYDEGRHLIAYRYARELARGRRVLDAGCGEGFPTRALAETASSVVGADYHAGAIATARQRSPLGNLRYEVADLTDPGAMSERF